MASNTTKPRAVPSSATTKNVVDLDAARAQRLEASGQSIPVTFGGETFHFPNPREWDVSFLDHLREGELSQAVRAILGDDEAWHAFMAHKPTLGDVEHLLDALGANTGVGGGWGNSPASATSSPATPKR